MKILSAISCLVLAGCGACFGADLAVLHNGNSIRHDRKEVLGAVTRLYLGAANDGFIEIPSDQIDHFERDASPPQTRSAPTMQPVALPQAAGLAPLRQQALTTDGLNQLVSSAGERHQLDPDFIRSVIKAESGFHQNAVSRKGALGLMQLMPGTASQMGITNPFDPHSNVEGGTKYLRELLEKYNFDVNKALAAYNAGPKRVDQYHGIPPYYETQAYVARIIRDFNRQKIAKNPALAKKSARQSAVSKKASAPTAASSSLSPKIGRTVQTRPAHVPASLPKGPETASR